MGGGWLRRLNNLENARLGQARLSIMNILRGVKATTRSFYISCVQQAVEHIVSNLDGALEVEALARRAALSPYHFQRVFRGLVGETPLELLRRLRLERAAWQLLNEDSSVTRLAFEAGYETHEAFTRAFRARYGKSPSAYRREARQHPNCATWKIQIAASCGVHFDPTAEHQPITLNLIGDAHMDVEFEQLPTMRIACVSHQGLYNLIGSAFDRLGAIAGPAGLFQHPNAAMIATYHDDPETTPADELRSRAGIVVPEGVPLPEGLSELRVAEGRYARFTHRGSYAQLGDAWTALLGKWLPASGKRMAEGVAFELYRNDPSTTPQANLRTDIYIPIAES